MIFDIIVLVVLLISAVIAFLRGFIREVLTILGVGGGLAAAYFGGPFFVPHMREWFGVEEDVIPERLFGLIPYNILADVLAYGSIFIIVVILLSILSHVLAETAKTMGMGAIDRTLGFIFGLARGLLLLGLLYLPFYLYADQDARATWTKDSRTSFYVEKTSEIMAGFLPQDTVKKMEEKAESTREKLESIDLLRKEDDGKQDTAPQDTPPKEEGYSDEFRNKMDQLFEEKKGNNLNE